MEAKQVNEDGYCYVCGGKGFTNRKCPSCGRESKKLSINLTSDEESDAFIQKIDAFGIPGKYRGIFWNAEMLQKAFPGKEQDISFKRFIDQLDKINELFVSGRLTESSAIIVAPAGFSKMTFAYSCMQRALDHGLTVAPFLDTTELQRLLVLAGDKPFYKLWGTLSYEEYVMSDVCFVTVDKLQNHQRAFSPIQALFDKRTRKGLGTFVVSRYDLNEISKEDFANEFDVVQTAVSKDYFKYPAIIRYRGRSS